MIRARIQSIVWLLLLLAAAWALRAPYLGREQWNLDEASTFTMAQQIRDGAVLYRDAVDQRAPLVPYLKAAVFAVAGDWNVRAVHLSLALLLGLVAFLLGDLARRLGERATGIAAALVFTVLSVVMVGSQDALAAHTEWFVILFSTLGFWLFALLVRRGDFLSGAAVGVVFAASALCKQPGLLDFGVTWVILALLAWRQAGERARLARFWLGGCAGVIVVAGATAAFFWQYGALRDFIYYAWTYNLQMYIPEVSRWTRLAGVRMPFVLAAQHAPVLALVAVAGAIGLLTTVVRDLRARASEIPVLAWLILGWSASGLASTMLSGRDYEHYSIQVIPGVSLASGWLLARLWERLRRPRNVARWQLGALGALLVLVGAASAFDVLRFSRKISRQDDPGWQELGDLVRRYSKPDEPIFVWGYYPDGYLLSRRLPSTRFIYPNFLTGLIPWTNVDLMRDTRYAVVPGAWTSFWKDYRAKPPVVIMDAVMRGYLKYPLLAQSGLRDEVIDHFAEVHRSVTEPFHVRILRRLAPVAPATKSANAAPAPIDPAVQLLTRPIPAAPDIVEVTVVAPTRGADVTLRVGGRPYRRLVVPAEASVEATFILRIADLAPAGAGVVDAIVEKAGHVAQSAPLDLIRRLRLEPVPAAPQPVLDFGNTRIASLSPTNAEGWRAEPRGQALGWRTKGPFALSFARPPGMDLLHFDWQPAALKRGAVVPGHRRKPEIRFIPDRGEPTTLSPTCVPGDYGCETMTVELPHAQGGQVSVQWMAADALAVVSSSVWIGELQGAARGPGLALGNEIIPPTLATASGDAAWTPRLDKTWSGPAPSHLIYPRTEGMNSVVFDYGIDDRAYTNPPANAGEGAIIEVNFIHADGHRENLLSEALRPRLDAATRGVHHARISLPEHAAGELEVKFNPIPANNAVGADAYVSRLRVQGPGPDLILSPDRVIMPTESSINGGEQIHTYANGRWIAHAPGHVVYPCPADLRAVTIGFGIEEGAYQAEDGSMRTNGIDVIAEFRDDAEKPIELFHRRLNPHTIVADRGLQHARLELPGRAGRLVLHMAPGADNDTAYDWSYWTDFTGEVSAPGKPASP